MANSVDSTAVCAYNLFIEIVQWTVIGMGLITTSTTLIIGHIERKQYLKNPKTMDNNVPFIFRYMFYACLILAITQLLLEAFSNIICQPSITFIPSKWSTYTYLSSWAIYVVLISHLFMCWLVRLYKTFYMTTYQRSNRFYTLIIVFFVMILLCAFAGLCLHIFDIKFGKWSMGPSLVTLAAAGYLIVSICLLQIFLRQLLQLVTSKVVTLRAQTKSSLQERTSKIDLSYKDQKLINVVSRYFTLGLCSFFTTLLVLIAMVLQFLEDVVIENKNIMFLVLQILVMIDVITNSICIYLQYNFANKSYKKLCGWLDKKVYRHLHNGAVNKVRRDTFSFYADKFKGTLRGSNNSIKVSLDNLELDLPVTEMKMVSTDSGVSPECEPSGINHQRGAMENKNMSIDFDKLLKIPEGNELNKRQSINSMETVMSRSEATPSPPDPDEKMDNVDENMNTEEISNADHINVISDEVIKNNHSHNASNTEIKLYRVDTGEMEDAMDIYDDIESVPSPSSIHSS